MGTKVQFESYLPAFSSMRDLNEDSSSCSWPLYCMDKTFTNGQYYNGFLPRAISDVCPGNDKDAVKQTMLEHEAIFKDQVHELHRLYRIQRDLMDEVKRKEPRVNQIPIETSFSSSPLGSQITSEDARKWQSVSFANFVCPRPSTSGVEDIHSPLSSMKGSPAQASPLPSQNGGTSKDVEILESRPTKVRRKMFDLQLPADEYIETEEGKQFRNENTSGISRFLPYRNHKIAPESGNLFLVDGGRNSCQGGVSRSESCLRSTNNVADLNKPIEVEETNASRFVNLLGSNSSHGVSQGHELESKQKSQLVGFPREISVNSLHGSDNGTLDNTLLPNNANRKQWFPHILDAGHSKNKKSDSPCLQLDKLPTPSHPIQILFNKPPEPASLFLTDQSKVDQLRERTARGLNLYERNHEIPNNNGPESVIASHVPIAYPIASSSDVSKSWSQSVSAGEKPNGSLNQQLMSVQLHPFFNSSATLSRSSQSSTQSHGFFPDQWSYNSNAASNATFGGEMPYRNGFYHGSSSGSKELQGCLPSGNYDYWNCSSNHSSAKFYKGANCMDLKSAKDVDLNVVLSNDSSIKLTPQQGIEVVDVERKHENHISALPWVRSKPTYKNEATNTMMDLNAGEMSFLQSSVDQMSSKTESGKGPNQVSVQSMKSASRCNVAESSPIEIGESSSCKKILGFPILEKPHISKNESSSFTSPSVSLPQPSEGEIENNSKSTVLDINLPCDPAVPDFGQQIAANIELVEKQTDTTIVNLRHQIDLNSCITEDEACLWPSVPRSHVKTFRGIDLEAPVVLETEEDVISKEEKAVEACLQLPQNQDENLDDLIRVAAESIVAISSSGKTSSLDDASCNPPEASMTDPLHWFVEIISSCGVNLESKFDAVLRDKDDDDNGEPSSEGFDYFESMTLGLTETKEDDYMPKPLVPENLKLEETGTTPLITRTRKGPARRGRPRRDFQRDILPGLASLSRHEVTEDLQTFGGMMRATGHSWHSGLMRRNSTRNGCARGRRRLLVSPSAILTASPPCTPLIQQLNNIEIGLEDRSLTGWGKTTRRPRRQRCPAGNPPLLPLT